MDATNRALAGFPRLNSSSILVTRSPPKPLLWRGFRRPGRSHSLDPKADVAQMLHIAFVRSRFMMDIVAPVAG